MDEVLQFTSERFNEYDELFWEVPFLAFIFFPKYSEKLVEILV